MNVKEMMALLETCQTEAEISIYLPTTDDGAEDVHEIARVDRLWDNPECDGPANVIGIVATDALAELPGQIELERDYFKEQIDEYVTAGQRLSIEKAELRQALERLREKVRATPGRTEPIGGQMTTYVQKDEVLGWFDSEMKA